MKNYIEYSSNLDNELLRANNIVIAPTCVIESGVKIYYNSCILGNSVVLKGATIFNNSTIINSVVGSNSKIFSSMIDQSEIGANCTIGPFASIKDNSKISNNCSIGNFVEMSEGIIAENVQIKSLAIIKDSRIEEDSVIESGVTLNQVG